MENYILQLLKNGIEEIRSERYQISKNSIAKGLTEFIDQEMKRNQLTKKQVHYKLFVGSTYWELLEGQSPRGLRNGKNRPDKVKITTSRKFSSSELSKHILYLEQLLMCMDHSK